MQYDKRPCSRKECEYLVGAISDEPGGNQHTECSFCLLYTFSCWYINLENMYSANIVCFTDTTFLLVYHITEQRFSIKAVKST